MAGDVRVMTGSALSALNRCMLDPSAQRVLQIVAAETDFLLVDLLSGSELGRGLRHAKEKTDRDQTQHHPALSRPAHCAPPWPSVRSRWQVVQSPSPNGICTSGRSIPAIWDA